MPTTFEEIRNAFDFTDFNGGVDHHAVVCRSTGKIYTYSDLSDYEEFNDELPDDVEDDEKYVAIPTRKELGIGKPLVMDFAREFLTDDFDEVGYMFSKRGAYQKFRALLTRRSALDRWYAFESQAAERALRLWCADQSIEIAG